MKGISRDSPILDYARQLSWWRWQRERNKWTENETAKNHKRKHKRERNYEWFYRCLAVQNHLVMLNPMFQQLPPNSAPNGIRDRFSREGWECLLIVNVDLSSMTIRATLIITTAATTSTTPSGSSSGWAITSVGTTTTTTLGSVEVGINLQIDLFFLLGTLLGSSFGLLDWSKHMTKVKI